MIIFSPKIDSNAEPLSPETIQNAMNKGMANEFTKRFGLKHCDIHIDFVNKCTVDLTDSSKGIVAIQSVCCDKFKPFLELISQNQDPESPIE